MCGYRILQHGAYTEARAASIIYQILSGVSYLHSQGMHTPHPPAGTILCALWMSFQGNCLFEGTSRSYMLLQYRCFVRNGEDLDCVHSIREFCVVVDSVSTGPQSIDNAVLL
jgi:hypothetical protein